MRYGIAVTYRCNLACKRCNRFLDLSPWSNSDVTVEDVKLAGKLVLQRDEEISRVRLTGGEPTLHPQLREICEVVKDEWKPTYISVVLTNGSRPRPSLDGTFTRYSWPMEDKESIHRSHMVSPADLGLEPHLGFGKPCDIQKGCGRLFDAFGFSFCVLAGGYGRILGVDPYQDKPVIDGQREICQHCMCTLKRRQKWDLWGEIAKGAVPTITKTWAEGLQRHADEPIQFKTFKARRE